MAAPGCQAKEGLYHACLGDKHEKALAPGAWSKGRPSVVTQGDRYLTRVTGGNPGDATI